MPPDYERRSIERRIELRAAPDGVSGPGTLVGYGAVFDSPSRDLGGFVEVIERGAFGSIVDGSVDLSMHGRVLARLNHENGQLLGTTDAGTLRLFVDDIGLGYEVDLPDVSYARDLAVLAVRGDIRYSSFAFRTLPDGDRWGFGANDELIRYVTGVSLVDVAPVSDPAYWETTSTLLRSFDLDAVKASLKPTETDSAPFGQRAAVRDRGKTITHTLGRDAL